jgi:ATP-binding cassette, subfamily B, bacterial MsbA
VTPTPLLQQIRIIAPFTKGYGWAAPGLAVLGLCASVAESLAISLVTLFLYTVIGPGPAATGSSGLLGSVFTSARSVAGDSSMALAVMIVVLVTLKAVLNAAYRLLASLLKNAISERVRNAIYSQYLQVSYGYLQRRDRGELVNVLATESWTVAEAFYSLTRIGSNLCTFAVFGVVLFAIAWQIALAATVTVAATFAVVHALSRPAQRLGEAAIEANRALAEQMVNTLQGMRTIRAFGQERLRERMFGQASRRARRSLIRLDQVYGVITPIGEIASLVLLASIVWMATALNIGFAATLSAVALLYRLQPYVREFEGNRLKLAGMSASLGAVEDVVSPADKNYPPIGSRAFAGLQRDIRFEDVSLTYPEAESASLTSVSFTIRRGTTTAIVGPSGAGKTTIVSLLLRLYEPSTGSILVDGTPLHDIERGSWLARIAVAGQDAELIDDTVIENIRLARLDATLADIDRAARLAGVHDFITSLPDGLDSWIGVQGLNLSGGQRQRIGLARALVRNPELLILDEATNAVDKQLERDIRSNVSTVMSGGTIVIITHRVETVLDADHVIYLQDGRVVAQGRPTDVFADLTNSA